MHTIALNTIGALLVLAAIVGAFTLARRNRQNSAGCFTQRGRRRLIACNIAAGTHEDTISLISDEAVATRHLLMTQVAASDTDHFAICQAGEEPIGFCPDEVASDEVGETRAIHLLSRGPTRLGVAVEAVTKGERAYAAAGGKLQDEPATDGTFYCVGRFMAAAGADEEVEVETHAPIKVVRAAAADFAALKALMNGPHIVVITA